jgi:NAD(P)-dependent dehydrogenase (short-subunit alcohol dehydrogenase family)
VANDGQPDLTGKVAVVTGANSGIGKETAVALASMGATVVMAARNRGKGEAAATEVINRSGSGRVVVGDLDLASFASIRAFASWLLSHYHHIDILVNNAGLIVDDRQETAEGFEMMFGVNHVGHFLLTDLLKDRLIESGEARIVTVSSTAHRWAWKGLPKDDLDAKKRFRSSNRYGVSKLANILFTLQLAERLQGTKVTANCLHPGSIHSGFGGDGDTGLLGWFMKTFGRFVLKSPAKGARTTVYLCSSDDPHARVSGGYFVSSRLRKPSKHARNMEDAAWLWEETERLVAAAS